MLDRKSEEAFVRGVNYCRNEYVYSNSNHINENSNGASTTAYTSNLNLNRKRAFSFAATEASLEASLLNGINNANNNNSNFGSGTNSTTPISEKRTATKICRVCGDKAFSYNFNVITCESCKAFFRRNANKEKVYF